MPRPKSSTKVKYLMTLEPHVKKAINILSWTYEAPVSVVIESLIAGLTGGGTRKWHLVKAFGGF